MSRLAKHHPTVEQTMERLRKLRLRLERQLQETATGYRRAEDRYRDEYRDQRAVVLNPPSAVSDGVGRAQPALSPPRLTERTHVRIVKRLPAPIMDGFDVGGLRVDCVYDVDARTGRYLVIAGYAQVVTERLG